MKHHSRAGLVVYVLELAGLFYLGCDSKPCDLDLHTKEASLVLLKGDTGSVLCDASCYGTYDITVTWTDPRDNEIGPHPHRIFSQLLNDGQLNKLVITGADTDLSGSYVCTAARNGQVVQRRAIDVYVYEESPVDASYKHQKDSIPRVNDPTQPREDPFVRHVRSNPYYHAKPPATDETDDTRPATDETDDTRPATDETDDTRPATDETDDTRPATDETDDTRPATDETDDGTNDYADMELMEAMAWNKKLAGKKSGNVVREVPLGYHDNTLEPGTESLVLQKGGETSEAQASQQVEHVVNHMNFDALNDSDVEINDFHDTLPKVGDEIPQSHLRYRRDINNTVTSGDDSFTPTPTAIAEPPITTTSLLSTRSVPTLAKDDGGETSTKPATHCTTPKPSNFGKYGVLAFAVSLSLAFLLLYAILMIVFMPRVLARRRATSQSDPEAQHYKKRNSDGLEAPQTMTSNDTTLSDNEAGDAKVKKDGDKSTTTESENENATASDEGKENTDESTDQSKADDKKTEVKADTKQDGKSDTKHDDKADVKQDPQEATQKPAADDQNLPDPTTPAPGPESSLLSSILNENFVGHNQPTTSPGLDHSKTPPDQDTSDLPPPPPSDSQLPVIDFTFDVRPLTTQDATPPDEVDV